MSVETLPLIDFVTRQSVVTGGVIALGNFDGVHLGHRAVIDAAVREAEKLGIQVHALTFEPHPYTLFQKEAKPFLLTPLEMKTQLLKEMGVAQIITLPFTPDFAAATPNSFVEKILIDGCGAQHVVIGFDFSFGQGRKGNHDLLCAKLKPLGIGITQVPPFRDATSEIISSSRIRSFLRDGQIEQANACLGRAFVIEGLVEKGDQRGRTLGFPTANIQVGELVRPAYGVYVVKARAKGTKTWLNGMANIGIRPSIGGKKELLEVNLFDFDQDIYDQTWEVALLHFLRVEKTFASMDALTTQIRHDEEQAIVYLKT